MILSDALTEALQRLAAGESLSADEASAALAVIMAGDASEARIAAFLMGLRVKGETEEEILGCARAMRAHGVRIAPARERLIDTCGTGGDGAHTINISTLSALVAAAAGVAVAKHGNRSVSSRCGSADVLEALGVRMLEDPGIVQRCVEEVGFGFMFAPHFHPAMRHVAPVRRSLGLRTVFNLLGPLTNPAGAGGQVIGVYDRAWCHKLAEAAGQLGVTRCLVVHGHGGLDEISLSGPTFGVLYDDGYLTEIQVTPQRLGLEPAPLSALAGGDPQRNAELSLQILQGEPGPQADAVVVNAAAALWVGGVAEDLRQGVDLAARALSTGAARDLLEDLRRFTAGEPATARPRGSGGPGD